MKEQRISGGIFDVGAKELMIKDLQGQTEDTSFWNDQTSAQKILQQIKSLKVWVDLWNSVSQQISELDDFIQLAQMENDESLQDRSRASTGESSCPSTMATCATYGSTR